jgi:hypothetical protein
LAFRGEPWPKIKVNLWTFWPLAVLA